MLTTMQSSEAAQAADTAANSALKDARLLAINTIQPSPYNKTRSERIQPAWLEQLAASIKTVGILQPIVVRPIQAPTGRPQFEIVAGECRWRASQQAGLTVIPTVVKELTDLAAREMMVMENTHRNDLHPLEEAEAYEALLLDPPKGAPRLQGYTPDELAVRFGKSRTYIYNRLKLLDLLPEGRKAFYAGDLSASTAQMVARMPAHFQLEAIKRMKQGWGGEPMSTRQAAEFIQSEYMLQLGKAPFKITDESLLPDVGSCKACPKRTGANPDLFNDVKGADVCTDPKCFNAKKEAHAARVIEQAKEEGLKVIQGKEAKAIKTHSYGGDMNGDLKGYVRLDKVHHNIDSSKPLEKLLGKDGPEVVLLEDPQTHEVIKVVKTTEAMAVLKEKGIVKGTALSSASSAERTKEKRRKADMTWRQDVARDLLSDVVKRGGFDDDEASGYVLPEIARLLWKRLGSEDCKRVEKLLGVPHQVGSVDAILDDAPDDERFCELLMAMLLAPELSIPTWQDKADPPAVMIDIAVRFGYDEAALLAERLKEIKSATSPEKKPAAKKAEDDKPAAKKAAAKKATAQKAAAKKAPAKKAASVASAAPKAKAPAKTKAAEPPASKAAEINFEGPLMSKSGKHWHGQHVRLKASKKLGQVVGTGTKDAEVIKVRFGTADGKEGDYYEAIHASSELEVLPGQTSPMVAWPFPTDKKAAA